MTASFEQVNMVTKEWNDKVCEAFLKYMIHKTVAKICQENPAKENWCVSGQEMGV